MNRKVAQVLSIIFHPVFLNLFGFMLLFACVPYLLSLYNTKGLLLIGALFTANTVILPLVLVLLMKLRGQLSSFQMEERKERRWPLLLISVIYVSNFYISQKIGLNSLLLKYYLGSASVIIFAALINNFYKISLHGAGLGALLGLVFSLSFHSGYDLRPVFATVCIVTGLVGVARFTAGSHTTAQWYLGNLVGFALMYVVI